MKKLLLPIVILLSLVSILSGCDLYMDESDLKQDNTMNGDGYSAPKTYTDSISTFTYQFNEGVVFIDEKYRPHIFSTQSDTALGVVEIRFAKSIPGNLMPSLGNYLYTGLYDIFEFGLCHQIDVVEQAEGCYVVKGHKVSMRDIFKVYRLKCDFYLAADSVSQENESRSANGEYAIQGRIVPVAKARSSRWEKEFHLINVPLNLAGYAKSPNIQNLVTKELLNISKGPLSDNSRCKLSGELDGYLGAEYVLDIRMSINVDIGEGLVDVRGRLHQGFFAGCLLSRAKANLSIPIFGSTALDHLNPYTNERVKFRANDYILKGARVVFPPISTPAGILEIYATPNFTLDLYTEFKSSEPIGVYYQMDEDIFEFGFHRDPKEKYSYPREKKSSRGISDFFPGDDQLIDYDELGLDNTDSWKFVGNNGTKELTIGAALNLGIEEGVLIDKLINIYFNVNACYDISYNQDFSDKYKARVSILDLGAKQEEELGFANNSKFKENLGVMVNIGARFDYFIDQVDLISIHPKKPFPIIKDESLAFPEMETTVLFNDNLTTDKESWYLAKVKTKNKEYSIDPLSVPRLAIFRTTKPNWTDVGEWDWEFVKIVLPVNEDKKFNKKTVYEYDFGIPIEGSDVLYNRNRYTYIALPYFKTFGGNNYSLGTSFKINGVWGILSDAEQVRVTNATFGDSQTYGFKFSAKTNNTIFVSGWDLRVIVHDASGRPIATKTFDLGKLGGTTDQKFIMFFNGKTNQYYKVAIELYYKNINFEHEEGTFMASELIEIQPAGGTTEVDYSTINSSTGFSEFRDYQILE